MVKSAYLQFFVLHMKISTKTLCQPILLNINHINIMCKKQYNYFYSAFFAISEDECIVQTTYTSALFYYVDKAMCKLVFFCR